MLNGLDLFSGIGGLSIALEEWVRPIAYCEIDPYCQAVLINRMAEDRLSKAPIWDDIRTLSGNEIGYPIDIIFGGFPCQDISVAGLGKGLDGERSGLFFEIVRLAKEIKPKFIFLENVPAITSRGGLRVVREIAEMGYDCRWCVISAASVGAPHRRDRWFCLAHANCQSIGNKFRNIPETNERIREPKEYREENSFKLGNGGENVANSGFVCERCLQKPEEEDRSSFHHPRCGRFWEIEPSVGRVVDGISQRVDRIKSLGNAVVPEQAKEAFKILMGLI